MDIREQRFGIGIELTGITRSSAARAVAGNFGTQSDHVGGGYDAYHVVDAAAHTPKTLRTLSNIVASKEDLLYRALGVGRSRIEPQVREPHAVEALPAERGDLGVQALAQARDLGLRHGRHAKGPRHLLDLARGDAEHVHLGHRGDERAVRLAVAL